MTLVILCVVILGVLRRVGGPEFLGALFPQPTINIKVPEDRFYLPANGTGTIYHLDYYSFSYSEKFEQAEWVAYILERTQLDMPNVKRTDNFRADLDISTRSADPNDYRGSGYDRGHLVPAADMAFGVEAMSTTFLMSNISPQVHTFNGGIWRELEELTRGWAKYFKRLYVVSGPILTEAPIEYIGRNKVAVPSAFFKVLLDIDEPEQKGIAFLIPNAKSDAPLQDYMLSIDSLESITGFDFYPDLLEDQVEEKLESEFNPDLWKTNDKKYHLRVEKWNNQ